MWVQVQIKKWKKLKKKRDKREKKNIFSKKPSYVLFLFSYRGPPMIRLDVISSHRSTTVN